MKNKCVSIGGQALIEGIMMKAPTKTVMSVRLPDGSIDTEEVKETHLKDKYKFFGLPLIRGVVNLIESFTVGYKALMLSAEKSGFAEDEELDQKEQTTLMAIVGVLGTVLGVGLALLLFMYLPHLLFKLADKYLAGGAMSALNLKPLFEGIIKILIFIGYVASVSLMKDIKRVFMYHGAEHKTIFCFEAGEELTVENVKKFSRFHPRCGTSFLFLMLAVSILVTSLLAAVLPSFVIQTGYIWVPIKILLIPLCCGLGYELIKICGKYDNAITKIIAAPGLWIQRLTTKEPTDDMMEIAIASVKGALDIKDEPEAQAETETDEAAE
ncbi:MAG: DUF1385 domain-containing protein [Clostridia bacterium]|nr:DUF1385 domain-containing protein [Clostridia bacterium]